jgi:hypothetical protein
VRYQQLVTISNTDHSRAGTGSPARPSRLGATGAVPGSRRSRRSAIHATRTAVRILRGLADQLIFTGDSINYCNRAVAANGGVASTESFFRYYLAPGVMHGGNWVENRQAPAVLDASGSINGQAVTRPLCPYPDPDAIYTGGSPDVASSYTCSSRPQFTNPFILNGQHGRLG